MYPTTPKGLPNVFIHQLSHVKSGSASLLHRHCIKQSVCSQRPGELLHMTASSDHTRSTSYLTSQSHGRSKLLYSICRHCFGCDISNILLHSGHQIQLYCHKHQVCTHTHCTVIPHESHPCTNQAPLFISDLTTNGRGEGHRVQVWCLVMFLACMLRGRAYTRWWLDLTASQNAKGVLFGVYE